MKPRNPRRAATALVLALAVLSGCSALRDPSRPVYPFPPKPQKPTRHMGYYTWTLEREPMEFYRWVVIGEDFANFCGFHSFKKVDGHKAACVTTLRYGMLQPGDRNIATGVARTEEGGVGKLCIVYSLMDEDEANKIDDKSRLMNIATHEVAGHCLGWDHSPIL